MPAAVLVHQAVTADDAAVVEAGDVVDDAEQTAGTSTGVGDPGGVTTPAVAPPAAADHSDGAAQSVVPDTEVPSGQVVAPGDVVADPPAGPAATVSSSAAADVVPSGSPVTTPTPSPGNSPTPTVEVLAPVEPAPPVQDSQPVNPGGEAVQAP